MTRGERLFNPGNIERGATAWQGMAADQPDSRFIKFASPEFGIRALAKILLTYSKKFKQGTPQDIDTVREIINRWAPPSENDTTAYVHHVAGVLGVGEDAVIDIADPNILEMLVRAIIKHENGRVIYSDAEIVAAIDRALA